MGLLDTVVFGSDRPVVVVECRHCGTSLDGDATTCPVCDADDIATYAIR